jgi:hypothetical protein
MIFSVIASSDLSERGNLSLGLLRRLAFFEKNQNIFKKKKDF